MKFFCFSYMTALVGVSVLSFGFSLPNKIVEASPVPGPIGQWGLNESSGTTASDSAGSNPGTLSGATWTTAGKIGNALSFDGVNDYVSLGTSNTLTPTSAVTLAAWVKTTSSSASQMIVSQYGGASNGVSPYQLRIQGGRNIRFSIKTNNVADLTTTGSLISPNQWKHVVGVWDGAVMKVYVNGVVASPAVNQSGSMVSSATDTRIGGSSNGILPFKGVLDEVYIYDRALSAAEVSDLYNGVLPPPPFDFSLANGGNKTVVQGQPASTTITATLTSGSSQPVAYSVSGLPTGAQANFSSNSCNPTCSTVLTITTSTSTPLGNHTVTVTGTAGVTKNTSFTLTVDPQPVVPPIQVETYPGPGTNTYISNLYAVEVFDGVNWVPSYTYKFSRPSVTLWHNGSSPSVNFTTFGTSQPVNVRVSKLSGPITNLEVSPKSKNISVQITGGKAILSLDENDKAWITVNGDDANPLFVFADPFKPAVPAGATYFGPGVHTLAPSTNNHYNASTNEVIYLDGGAWVRGNIDVRGASNVKIMGPGILSGDVWTAETVHTAPWPGILDYAMITGDWGVVNVSRIEGITIVNSPAYNVSAGVDTVYGVKLLSPWHWSTDGFQSGVSHVDQSFAFVGDNVFFPIWAGVHNNDVTITNSFAGTTGNSVFSGGYWGNDSGNLHTALSDNIDIKTYNSDAWVQYGAPLTPALVQVWVDNSSSALGYRNQTYNNIRIEGDVDVPLIQLKNTVYPWPGASAPNPPLGNSENIKFKDITLEGTQKYRSEVKGWDVNNIFDDVTLEDVKINGVLVSPSNVSNYFDINSHVTNLSFGPNLPLPPPFDFSLANGGNKTVVQGQPASTTITATLTSGSSQPVAYSVSGLPTGAQANFSSNSCNPTCSTVLTITTSTSTPLGNHTVTVTGTAGVTKNTSFTLTVDPQPVVPPSPTSWWKLNESSGTTASDSAGSNPGTLSGATWTTSGKIGNALSFDGLNDYVNFGDKTLFERQNFTVSFWVKRNGAQGDWVKILNKGKGDTAPWASYKFEFNGPSDETLNWHLGFTDGTSVVVQNQTPLSDGQWTQFVGTFDGTTARLYKDGVLQGSNSVGSKTVKFDSVPLSIGGYIGWGYFKGFLDDVRMYDRALTSQEISDLYNSTP